MKTTKRFLTITFLFISTASLLACNLLGSKNAGDLSNTGVTGTIVFGPLTPVAVEGEPNVRPHQAEIHVVDSGENLVHSFSSDENGVFQVVLEPGNYVLLPQVDSEGDIVAMWPRSQPYTVQVNLGTFTEVDIVYDSGIR